MYHVIDTFSKLKMCVTEWVKVFILQKMQSILVQSLG